MSDDVRVRNGFRRRRTTRRLLRHPARIAARADQSEQQLKLDAGASTRLKLEDDEGEATLEVPVVEDSASQPLTAATAHDLDAEFISDDETTDVAERERAGAPVSEVEGAASAEQPLTAAERGGPPAETNADTANEIAVAVSDAAQAASDAESDSQPSAAGASADGQAQGEGFEPKTNELHRPAPVTGAIGAVDKALELAGSAAEFSPIVPAADPAADGGDDARPEAAPVLTGKDEAEVKTKPKIRLPEGAPRRATPPPPTRAAQPEGRISSPLPPPRLAARAGSPLPPAPAGASIPPRGEGIVRTSQPPVMRGPNDRDSEAPTRPRIPLTHDMALAAGRITSQEVTPFGFDDGSLTRPRVPAAGGDSSVLVTRARVISDRPGANAADSGEPSLPILRRSRRPRPDSEEFETLDIEEGVEDPPRLELNGLAARSGSENGVRVSRTPPPPPNQGKRATGAQAVQRAAPPPPPPNAAAKKQAPAPAQKAQPKKRAWWEVLFSDDYVRTLPRLSSNTVAKQVSFMETSLGVKRGDAVLDVGCGLGQHALEFARRGYLVVALDLALSMITRAAEEAQQRGLRINFLHKDIRDIGFEGTFDAIICVGTTFGFFDDEQNRNVLGRLAHALKPGGKLLIEIINRDYVIRSQPNLVWFEGEGCVVMEESDFNYYSSRLNVKRTMMREDGRQSESEYSIRLYSVHELGQLLKQAGFSIKEVSGQEATRGLFFGSHSTRIIMLAERRTTPRSSNEQSIPPGADG